MFILNTAKCEYFDASALSPAGDIFKDAITSDGLKSHGAIGALTVMLFDYDAFDGPYGPPHPSIGAWAGDPIAMSPEAPENFSDITAAARDALKHLQQSVWKGRFDSGEAPEYTEKNVIDQRLTAAVWTLRRYPEPLLNMEATNQFIREME